MKEHVWIELDRAALLRNVTLFKKHLGADVKLLVPVKANGYGHGLPEMASMLRDAGVDWIGVHSFAEACVVREVVEELPILILGYVPFSRLAEVVGRGFRLMVSSWETADALARAASSLDTQAKVHIKIETGTHRQGVAGRDLQILARFVVDSPHLLLEGCATHFANIEDTTNHSYAMGQIERFVQELDALESHGIVPEIRHTACSAAAMLFADTHYDMVRTGISIYGLWPSKETFVSMKMEQRDSFSLSPLLTWKTLVAQLKDVPAGGYIGYGCSYRTTRDIRLAILPIGYYDGYSRALSNVGYVLLHGCRAPIRGRICMNLTMVDVTDIPGVKQEDEVVLLGRQGEEEITADLLASMIGTIHYEVVARIPHHIPRYIR